MALLFLQMNNWKRCYNFSAKLMLDKICILLMLSNIRRYNEKGKKKERT